MKKSFSEKVYQAIRLIPKGKVTTYAEVAKYLGSPKSYRAVGNALHKNPLPIIQPCHRVVNSKGELAKNFGLGEGKQEELLKNENVAVIDGKVDISKFLFKFDT